MNGNLNLFSKALEWINNDKTVFLATVISTWRSSPNQVGSQMIISSFSDIEGSVSGGCVESSVVNNALEMIDDYKPRTLEYGVSNEKAWEVGLACGGKIKVYLEKIEN